MGTGEPGEIPGLQEEQAAMGSLRPFGARILHCLWRGLASLRPSDSCLPGPSSTDAEKSRFWDVGGGLREGEIPDFHVEVIYL